MKRSEAREKVFQVVFQKEFHRDFEKKFGYLANELNLKGVQGEYATATIKGIIEKSEEIDLIIKNNIKHTWTFARLPKQTLAILRLGIYELMYNNDIPDVTAIDEAVKLAALYCDDNDIVFINGVLNKLYEEKEQCSLE